MLMPEIMYFILVIISANIVLGKDFIMEKNKQKYLVRIEGNNSKSLKGNNNMGMKGNTSLSMKGNASSSIPKTGMDYYGGKQALLEKCSLKRGRGKQKQFDVPGCGGRLDMQCDGGCLSILKVIYSCEDQSTANPEQLLKVQERCEEKEKCMVSASRQTFGDEECPDAEDYKMSMWIVYRCDGGEDNTRRTGVKECKKCGKEGEMIQKDVPGCGGKLRMACKGGCLKILKLLYSCKEKKNSNADQLERVKGRCEDKEECTVAASRDMFGYGECADASDDVMKMWVVYRCDGGIESHALTGPETCNIVSGGSVTNEAENCDKKDEGVMVQKDVPGCGGRIEMSCVGGRLNILKLLYSCQEKENSNADQLKLVKERCEDKKDCVVAANRDMFGYRECPDAEDDAMKMWIVYRCEGGCDSSRLTGPKRCKPSPKTKKCNGREEGRMVQTDVLGCGGKISISCAGGCLKILKTLYSCNERDQSIVDQLERVREICEDNESCVVPASREMFGEAECPGKPDKDMNLWLTYRCDGGKESYDAIGPRRCPKVPSPTTRKITAVTPAPLSGLCGSGKGVQIKKYLDGCGETLDMKCVGGGCIDIISVTYSCRNNDRSNNEQFKVVYEACDGKISCLVRPKKDLLGDAGCPDGDITMGIKYRCEGGRDGTRQQGPKCRRTLSTTTTRRTTTTIRTTTTRHITTTKSVCDTIKGQEEEKEVPGCGGRLRMNCVGGCIDISHVQYTCTDNDRSIPDQLKRVQRRCQGKSSCVVPANRRMFGDSECPNTAATQINMKVKYRCNGEGRDDTKVERRNDPKCKPTCPADNGVMKNADIPLNEGWINILCSVRASFRNPPKPCIFIHKVRAGCGGGAPIAEHMKLVKGMCDGKSFCRVEPTDKFFGYGVKCGGWKRMWITYSCDGGDDDTTKGITELACPADHGVMKNADIPLEGGWINILCSARANRNPQKPCIFIHKVRAGCGWGAPIAEHMKLVKEMCEGKSTCRVEPTDNFFGNGVKCGGWKRMWITYSCDGGTDKTTKKITTRPTLATTTPARPICPRSHGPMASRDIPLNGGSIDIQCVAGRGDRRKRQAGNMMMPCISIHKIRAACNSRGGTIPKQMDLIKRRCEGKSRCSVTPTSGMFNPIIRCWGKQTMWITYSCDGGTDRTSSRSCGRGFIKGLVCAAKRVKKRVFRGWG